MATTAVRNASCVLGRLGENYLESFRSITTFKVDGVSNISVLPPGYDPALLQQVHVGHIFSLCLKLPTLQMVTYSDLGQNTGYCDWLQAQLKR